MSTRHHSPRHPEQRTMLHFSCDVCGKTLNLDTDARFTWTIEGGPCLPEHDEENTTLEDDAESDLDAVDSMDELLLEREDREMHSGSTDTVEMLPVCLRRSFDLCGSCYFRQMNDPLGLASRQARPFSRN